MERAPKIIELYGLPGAGKTTICNFFREQSGLQVGKVHLVMDLYKKEALSFKIIHFPLFQCIKLTFFLLITKHKRGSFVAVYKLFYYLLIAYNYCQYQKEYEYIVVDHGMVQQLGSMLHNSEYKITQKALDRYSKLLISIRNVYYVYCYISKETALNRMRVRGRNLGRIDAVMDNALMAYDLMEKETNLFEKLSSALENSAVGMVADMESSKEELLNFIMDGITLKQ